VGARGEQNNTTKAMKGKGVTRELEGQGKRGQEEENNMIKEY
jgi:hypothetical protein